MVTSMDVAVVTIAIIKRYVDVENSKHKLPAADIY
jgi:hypothetical protein